MKEKREEKEGREIIIPIPKNKHAIIIENQDGVQIIWEEKELTWDIIKETLKERGELISLPYIADNDTEQKANVLLKLINIRNYFGKPSKSHTGYIIQKSNINDTFTIAEFLMPYMCSYSWPVFAKREHAEQALKILEEDVKYLFTPW
jgi:hypothetical protein